LGVYPGMGPAKTGWTVDSKHTYAASATREGRQLQLIILHSANKWNDAEALFDFGFEQVLHKSSLQTIAARTTRGKTGR
jgi:D-alanyl-D-alanine carboxypeptidase